MDVVTGCRNCPVNFNKHTLQYICFNCQQNIPMKHVINLHSVSEYVYQSLTPETRFGLRYMNKFTHIKRLST